MCLDKVAIEFDKPHALIEDGWKDFGGTASKPTFAHMGGEVKLDQWMRASGGDIKSGQTSYKAGFHVYADEDARSRNLRRVYVRRVTCRGDQSGKTVLIAQEMYVPSDSKAWPPKDAPPAGPPPPKMKSFISAIKKRGKP